MIAWFPLDHCLGIGLFGNPDSVVASERTEGAGFGL